MDYSLATTAHMNKDSIPKESLLRKRLNFEVPAKNSPMARRGHGGIELYELYENFHKENGQN